MILASSLSGFGIGWGKPVMVNPANFKHPRWDNLRVSLWGPLSNILTAIAAGAAFRLVGYGMGRGWIHYSVAMGNVYDFLGLLTLISIGLAIFNLIPIAPLDGSHIISSLLPIERARRYDMFMGRYGMLIFIALILMGTGGHGPDILGMILDPPRRFLWALLAGGLH
jgi:Zn-dependent protease